MLDYRKTEEAIVAPLKSYLSKGNRPCEVVRQNQVAKIPAYPYVSYTVTTPVSAHRGTYSEAEDKTLYRCILQTWSFTVQSDDQEEALFIAMKAYDFFTAAGLTTLADSGITVRRVRDVSTRDNLITIQYEYRNGFDVVFGLTQEIVPDEEFSTDEIDTIEIGQSQIETEPTADELNEMLEKRLDGES